ncbi:MAG: methyltransferase domain-containing protein, partial [Planctomycetes bacterium]|nr:methyltransferase domain-containing protein [Planctomycetota bacterium]
MSSRGFLYLVMEHLSGASLAAARDHYGDAAWATAMLRGVVDALVALHARGIVHRDLKPSNVVVVRERGGDVPKVIDFGLAMLSVRAGAGSGAAGADATTRFVDGAFRVLRCEGCDLTRVSPRLPEGAAVERVYDASYWRSPAARERGYSDYRGDAELYLRTFELRRARIAAHLPAPGRVLDVGCAAGYFLAVMRRAGWSVAGVEPSAPIRAAARARLGDDAVLAEAL